MLFRASLVLMLARFADPAPTDSPVVVAAPSAPRVPEIVGPSFRFGDFDADGHLDVYVVDPVGGDRLYRNQGDGTFADVGARLGLSGIRGSRQALWQDFDADGRLDLYVSASAGPSRLFRNDGGAGFSDVTAQSGLTQRAEAELFAEWIDYDGDTLADLHVVLEDGDRLFHNVGGVFEEVRFATRAASDARVVALRLPSADLVPPFLAGGSAAVSLPPTGGGAGAGSHAAAAGSSCFVSLEDHSSPGNCQMASSVPTIGMLMPLSTSFNVNGAGDVGVGTTTPSHKLDVAGNLRATGQLISSQPTGTAPLAVASTTKVTNLNADTLDGVDSLAFSQFGAAVDTAEIANGAVTLAKLAANAVDSSKIADATVFGADLLDGTVGSVDLASSSVTSAKIAPDAVDSTKIANGAVSSVDIAAGAINTSHYGVASVDSTAILNGTITQVDIAMQAITSPHYFPASVDSAALGASAVTNAKIAANAVDASKILDGSVTSADLATGAVASVDIQDGTIVSADLASGAVLQANIGTGQIASPEIANGSIYGIDVADGSLLTGDLVDGAVTSAKIADGTIAMADIGPNGASSGQVIKWSGSTWAPAADNAGSASQWLNNGSSIHYSSGNVGVGTTAPGHPFHVVSGAQTPVTIEGSDVGGTWTGLRNSAAGGDTWHLISTGPANGEGAGRLVIRDNDTGAQAMVFEPSGHVGVGTAGPEGRLHVYNASAGSLAATGNTVLTLENNANNYISMLSPDANERGILFGEPSHNAAGGILYNSAAAQDGLDLRTNGNVTRMVVTGTGNVGIGTSSPIERLDVAGATRTQCVKITGGCDLAEPFEFVDQKGEPGMVMTIDPDHEGMLRIATRAYDTTVAGVISGAGGVRAAMTMSQTDVLDEGELVALAGRVYAWCDASSGAIRPGDLLTSSDTAGHAMKVGDRERARGAIVGKALTSLGEGRGLVLMVVTLQ